MFSSSSEFVLPLLKQVIADVFGKADKLPDVFLSPSIDNSNMYSIISMVLGSKLCGPWHRRLEAIDSLNAVRCRRKSKALDSKQ